MKNGFLKVAAATPTIRVADTEANAREAIRLAKAAQKEQACVLVLPELCLTGATVADLYYSDTLLKGAKQALCDYLLATKDDPMLSVVGLPYLVGDRLYDCAAVCFMGKLLGLVPKTSFAKTSAASERHFSSDAPACVSVPFCSESVPFGSELTFACTTLPSLTLAVTFSDNLGTNLPTAALICRPTSHPTLVGTDASRRKTAEVLSHATGSAWILSQSGMGESTTDSVFGGHKLIVEAGDTLGEVPSFSKEELILSEIDLERLQALRRENKSTSACVCDPVPFALPIKETRLTRKISPQPFIPLDPEARRERCREILSMQTKGLVTRIERAYAKKIVLGISGGLDSTLALLVMANAMDDLNRPRTDIIAVTMPGFGTTARTKSNATVLCKELGVDFRTVNISDAVKLHFCDIGHDPTVRDVTYENAQARERTQVLMDIANDCGGMVIGTGDLSELALGWATYNGDHMSMYGVNADLPKTLIRHIVAFAADSAKDRGEEKIASSLYDILDTPVSPELLPAKQDGSIAQKTEDLVGPYEIHDFYLYYFLRYGFSPKKLYRLATYALGDLYDAKTLKKWLKIFLRRFFSQQFKRSCMPDGPRVGSVGLSPRGAWCMPSDALSTLWLSEAEEL